LPIFQYLAYFTDNKLYALKIKNGLKSILTRRFFGTFSAFPGYSYISIKLADYSYKICKKPI